MEFLNIGGGELLVIVLLAIVLFGPEDILRIMRAIGNYTRKIQQMWAQMSAGLKGEFIPDGIIPEEIRQTIEETKASVNEVKTTLAEVQTTVQTDIDDTKNTVKEVKASLREVDTSVKSDMREIPKAMRAVAKDAVTPKEEPDPEAVRQITALLKDDDAGTDSESESDIEAIIAEDTVVPAEADVATPESDEVAVALVEDETTESSETDIGEVDSPPEPVETVGTEPDPKTVTLIASLLEGKGRDASGEIKTESTTDEGTATAVQTESAEVTFDALPVSEPLDEPKLPTEVALEPADVVPVALPETPNAASTTQDEEV